MQVRKGQSIPSPISSDTTKEQSGTPAAPVDVTSPSNKFDTTKAQKRQSTPSPPSPIISDATKEQSGIPAASVDVTPVSDKVDLNVTAENDGSASMSTDQANKEQRLSDATPPMLGTPLTEMPTDNVDKREMDNVEVLPSNTDAEPSTHYANVSTNVEPAKENASDIHDGHPPPASEGIESASENQPTDAGLIINSGNSNPDLKKDQERSDSVNSDSAPNSDAILKDTDSKVESIDNGKSQEDKKNDASQKVEDPLDEVIHLL